MSTQADHPATSAHRPSDAVAVGRRSGVFGESGSSPRDWTDKPGMRDRGLLVWRLLALFMVFHGVHKIGAFEGFSAGLAKYPVSSAAPAAFAALVILGEIFLPLFIAAGFLTRLVAGLGAFMMITIWLLVHVLATKDGGWFSPQTGGLNGESAWLWGVFLLPLVWIGAGRLSVDQMLGRRRAERA